MFKYIADKISVNQLSLTGLRALILLKFLMEAPRTFKEIKEHYVEYSLMEANSPDDIIRIDINTLREMDCEITRADIKTNYRYTLLNHPFALDIKPEEINILKRAYKKIKEKSNIVLLLKYDELFKKLADHVADEDLREKLYGISVLKKYDTFMIYSLLDDCKKHRVLKMLYRNPASKKDSEKEICAQKLVFQNDKIYLYGYDYSISQSIILNIKRIKSILSRALGGDGINPNACQVKFILKNHTSDELEENETVLETLENGLIVVGDYYNEFVAVQRILSFGANCTVLESEEFKQKIIQKLKNIRENYNG